MPNVHSGLSDGVSEAFNLRRINVKQARITEADVFKNDGTNGRRPRVRETYSFSLRYLEKLEN